MSNRRMWWSVAGASLATLTLFLAGPELLAQRLGETTSTRGGDAVRNIDGERMERALSFDSARLLATRMLARSTGEAAEAAVCEHGEASLLQARDRAFSGDRLHAEEVLRALSDPSSPCIAKDEEDGQRRVADRARLQLGRILLEDGRPEDALEVMAAIENPTPVDDYLFWQRAEALEQLGRHVEAAELFGKIYEQGTSPLHWRARVRQGRALASGERYEQALPILEQAIELFPDYPRRHVVLYQRAHALEQLGKRDEAAEAYQTAWFEFPFRAEGKAARERLEALRDSGARYTPIARERLLTRYRALRVDKHWPLVHELLTELREANRTDDGRSAFENEVLLEIALNAYYRHHFAEAAEYFAQVREIYESGNTDGISSRTLYRFHSFALGRLGRYDEAIEALETMNEGATLNTRLSTIASFYEDHGQYHNALQIYDRIYSASRKRGWHYTWLLYKTGQFDQAYENLVRLASNAGGERRAKYLYWTARTLERGGSNADARDLFDEIARSYPSSYYGLQARSRLADIAQRESVEGPLLAEAQGMMSASEEVLDAFDEASIQLASRGPMRVVDPRMTPIDGAGAAALHDIAPCSNATGDIDCDDVRFVTSTRANIAMTPVVGPLLTRARSEAEPRVRAARGRGGATAGEVVVLDDDEKDGGAGTPGDNDAKVPTRAARFDKRTPRVRFNTDARIYWHGRQGSDVAFVNYRQGEMIGPVPGELRAYLDDSYIGGTRRAVEAAGDLFPELVRAMWLWEAGMTAAARIAIRDVSLEFRGLTSRGRATSRPHELPNERWAYYIDNRRTKTGLWGMNSDELRFPVPTNAARSRQLLARQQAIHDRRAELEPLLVRAFMEVGDYHLVRRYALGRGGWMRQEPTGRNSLYWQMAYPRAFPEQVIPEAIKNNVNPYMIWSLMLVESSFNPDSLSRADAKGLLQVIPRTGLKVAAMFGDEDFGPFDLLDEETAIRQGVFYFSKLVQKFHSQELLAFAGYNGGPHRVGAWLEMRGHDMPLDEFIEEIPYNEARGYAKKVLRFLATYLKIYEGIDHLYVGQNLRLDYLEQPDF